MKFSSDRLWLTFLPRLVHLGVLLPLDQRGSTRSWHNGIRLRCVRSCEFLNMLSLGKAEVMDGEFF